MDTVDILAFGAHPDDIELGCSGTLIKHIKNGYKVGLVDLTKGELGTRGSVDIREKEANSALKVIGAHIRENLSMDDGFITSTKENLLNVVKMIRKYRPRIVLCNAIKDRHPDHQQAAQLVSKACFLSGLKKLKSEDEGNSQNSHRPKAVYHYIQDRWTQPDLVIDISNDFDQKIKAIKSYKSQFYDPDNKEPSTSISTKEFLDSITSKAILLGRELNCKYGEGFTSERYIGVDDLMKLI